MALRLDYTDFPFGSKDKRIWFFVIDWKNKTKQEFSSVQEKREIVSFLRTIISSQTQKNYELNGVWNGQYRTDIFLIPVEDGYRLLKEHFPEKKQ